jgi:hypothetical protein
LNGALGVSAIAPIATKMVLRNMCSEGPIASHARAMSLSLPTEIGAIVANGIRETPEEKIYAAYMGQI